LARDLKTERLAAAGRNDDKGIIAIDQAGNDLPLRLAEGFIAKDLEQGILRVTVHAADPGKQICTLCI